MKKLCYQPHNLSSCSFLVTVVTASEGNIVLASNSIDWFYLWGNII